MDYVPRHGKDAPKGEMAPRGRARHIVTVAIVLAILFSPALFWGLSEAAVDVPLWLRGRLADWLVGYAPTIEWPQTPEEAAREFRDGKLQTTIEDALSQQIPLKAEAMMASGELQRLAIRASNLGFQWPAYPTFYGSAYYYLTEHDAIRTVKDGSLVDGWRRFSDQFASFASAHPEVEFRAYVVAEALDLDVNEALALTSDPVEATDCGEIIQNATAGMPNVQVLMEDYDDPAAYYNDYFKGDNHWTGSAAIRAYNRVAESLGMDALVQGEEVPYPIPWIGSSARAGLYWLLDDAVDIRNDYSSLTLDTEDGVRNGNDRSFYEDSNLQEQFTIYYGRYFGSYHGTVDNAALDDGSSAILVSDSFGAAFLEPMATDYQHVEALDWFYGSSTGELSLAEEIEQTNAKTVVFLSIPLDYSQVLDRHPNMFR